MAAAAQLSAYAVAVYYFHGKVNRRARTLIQQLLRGQGLNTCESAGGRAAPENAELPGIVIIQRLRKTRARIPQADGIKLAL